MSRIATLARELHHYAALGLEPEDIHSIVRRSYPDLTPDEILKAVEVVVEFLNVDIAMGERRSSIWRFQQ